MTIKDIEDIKKKAKNGEADLADIIDLVSDSFISASTHSREIKESLKKIIVSIQNLETQYVQIDERLSKIEAQLPDPIFQSLMDFENSEQEN